MLYLCRWAGKLNRDCASTVIDHTPGILERVGDYIGPQKVIRRILPDMLVSRC